MKRSVAAFAIFIVIPISAFGLAIGIGAHAYADIAGALGGTYYDTVSARYERLGASSFGDLGSASAMPAIAYGGSIELDLNAFPAPRFSLSVSLGYGTWGFGIAGEDSGGQGFASAFCYAPVLDLSAELRYSFRLGSLSIEPGLGLFVGGVFPRYRIVERISGVASSIDPSPLAIDAPVLGLSASGAYVIRIGHGRLRLGVAGALGQALAAEAGSLGGSMLWPWRIGLEFGYSYDLAGRAK